MNSLLKKTALFVLSGNKPVKVRIETIANSNPDLYIVRAMESAKGVNIDQAYWAKPSELIIL